MFGTLVTGIVGIAVVMLSCIAAAVGGAMSQNAGRDGFGLGIVVAAYITTMVGLMVFAAAINQCT